MLRVCNKCGFEKNIEEFNIKKSEKEGRDLICKECIRKYNRQYYEKNKNIKPNRDDPTLVRNYIYLCNYFITHPCVKCGENDIRVLEFHHRNPKEKKCNVSSMGGHPIENLQKEIDKCDVLCCNCHREKQHLDTNSWVYQLCKEFNIIY